MELTTSTITNKGGRAARISSTLFTVFLTKSRLSRRAPSRTRIQRASREGRSFRPACQLVFLGSPTVYPAAFNASMTSFNDSFSSSNSTETVWRFASAVTVVTFLTDSTAARALAAVLPQTTPGVGNV